MHKTSGCGVKFRKTKVVFSINNSEGLEDKIGQIHTKYVIKSLVPFQNKSILYTFIQNLLTKNKNLHPIGKRT